MELMNKFTKDEKIFIKELAGKQWGHGKSSRKLEYAGDVPGRPIGYACDMDGRLLRRSNNGFSVVGLKGKWATVNIARIANYALNSAKMEGLI